MAEWRDDKSDSTVHAPAPPKGQGKKRFGDAEAGDVQVSGAVVHDAVFGDIVEHGPNFRAVGGWGAFVLMTKANLGLGVLAIPVVFSTLGIVPGIIVIVVIECILVYCANFLGPFKMNHPEVYGLADAGFVFGGRWGKEIFYVIFTLFMVFCTASAIVGVSTALNAMSSHGACTAIFLAVAAVAGFLLGSIRTLGKVSWVGWAGITSVMVSIITLTVAVGVEDRPSEAPRTGPWDKNFKVAGTLSFSDAMTAINIILFSSSATPMYFGVLSEMRDPRQYPKAVAGSLTFLTAVYLIIGSVVYHYCGQYVASPALGSAGILMKKICYGLAFPGLLASLTIFNHISAKHLFVRILSGSRHLTANSWTHWCTWLGCTAGSVIVAYVIASAIPVFGSLIDFIGALLCPLVAIIPEILMWWHDNVRLREEPLTTRLRAQMVFNAFLLLVAAYLTVAGTYAAIVELIHTSVNTGPWTCANNSGRLD
ncbi:hypothetical protein Q8F55_002707 [Vanrija albida]|uniref:Amino acid transporter transmembrane domain-containing protein n=1 Tax=Vanrija albida TaxID=181172 RepID=A0ABR3QAM9_9TREE